MACPSADEGFSGMDFGSDGLPPFSTTSVWLPHKPRHYKQSASDLSHRIERAVLVPNVHVGQRVVLPIPIDHELVFMPPRH